MKHLWKLLKVVSVLENVKIPSCWHQAEQDYLPTECEDKDIFLSIGKTVDTVNDR